MLTIKSREQFAFEEGTLEDPKKYYLGVDECPPDAMNIWIDNLKPGLRCLLENRAIQGDGPLSASYETLKPFRQ
jgi:hypothetical protein